MAAALMTVVSLAPLHAQSFGRNKVHYHSFDFRILETAHFDIYYYPAEADAARQAGRLAERWYSRLSQALDHTLSERQPIVLYASHAQFTQTNVVPGFLDDGVGGITEHDKGRVVLPFAWSLGETDHVLGHELVHAFQRDLLRRGGQPLSTLPLWFVEGMAEYLSVGSIDPNTAMWLRDGVEQHRLPRLDQLDDPAWFPYRYGQALFTYLASEFGDDVVAKALKSRVRGGAIGRLTAVTGLDRQALSEQWHDFIRESVQGSNEEEVVATSSGEPMANAEPRSRFSVGPALSPDGNTIAFFSDRDRYSIDLVVADARSGAIRRKIIRTRDPRFESLQFIESAGAWNRTGDRLAIAALSGGAPVVAILNMTTGDLERQLPIRNADQIFSPTWSPDGRQIAFSALHGGFSDLDVVDLESGSIRSLTSDPFADLQPAWSPDGRTIAFASDRFSSSIDTLTFGRLTLASIDVQSGMVAALPGVPHAKNIDPHWSPDGRALYVVADPDGTSNVYRIDLTDGSMVKITNVSTGVSGVTALSPALAVAARGDTLAFSVYRHGGYQIRLMDADDADGGRLTDAWPLTSTIGNVAPSVREPADRSALNAASSSAVGLPDAGQFTSRPYRAGLKLDRIVQPYVSAGGGGGGSFLRAGAGVSFGDMLGNHELRSSFQVGKRSDDFAVQTTYLNMRSRWNWGLSASRIPWLTGATNAPSVLGADGMLVRESQLFRQLHRQVGAAAIYPLNTAQRLEFSSSLQSITFTTLKTTSEYAALTGRLARTVTSTSPAARDETLGETGAALVYDTALFGPTSPVIGRRYRFGISPALGGLTFTTVTADYRQYWMPRRPFTLAIRGMHLGRYGRDATDLRLLPLVWTLRDLVRGYGDTGAPASTGNLSATRMLVVNGEIRFPLDAILGHGRRSDALPIEGLVFSDVGRFWTPGLLSATRGNLLHSAGAGARLNAAGMIFELDAVRRLAGPSRAWTFSINFRPGF